MALPPPRAAGGGGRGGMQKVGQGRMQIGELRSLRTAKGLLQALAARVETVERIADRLVQVHAQQLLPGVDELKRAVVQLRALSDSLVAAQRETDAATGNQAAQILILHEAQARDRQAWAQQLEIGLRSTEAKLRREIEHLAEETRAERAVTNRNVASGDERRRQVVEALGRLEVRLGEAERSVVSARSEAIALAARAMNESHGVRERMDVIDEAVATIDRAQLRFKLDLGYLKDSCGRAEQRQAAQNGPHFEVEWTSRLAKLAAEVAMYRKMSAEGLADLEAKVADASRRLDVVRAASVEASRHGTDEVNSALCRRLEDLTSTLADRVSLPPPTPRGGPDGRLVGEDSFAPLWPFANPSGSRQHVGAESTGCRPRTAASLSDGSATNAVQSRGRTVKARPRANEPQPDKIQLAARPAPELRWSGVWGADEVAAALEGNRSF